MKTHAQSLDQSDLRILYLKEWCCINSTTTELYIMQLMSHTQNEKVLKKTIKLNTQTETTSTYV